MALFKTRAIVLKSINLSETDKLTTFYTESFGKVKCVAKAARRIKSRFGAALEPLSFINLIYFGKENQELYRLNHCDIIASFQSVRENLEKLYTAVYFLELMDVTVREGDRQTQLFQFFLSALHCVERQGRLETLIRVFELRLLALLGYSPSLGQCVVCRKEPMNGWIGFSCFKGGIVCPICIDQNPQEIRFQKGTLNYLKKLLSSDLKILERLKFPRTVEEELEYITHRMILSHVGRELKSYPFIKLMAEIDAPILEDAKNGQTGN